MEEKTTLEVYKNILGEYLTNRNETALYRAQRFSRIALENNTSPEEVINMHILALQEIFPELRQEVRDSFDLLLEVMMEYGMAYQEHQSLRIQQFELKAEIEVAANMQQTLLKTNYPDINSLDIGAVSVPSKKMNGDYFHFVQDENQCVSVAIADIIGKGIPAALCMSMIKYTMESHSETRMNPQSVLENLNRVVEQNVDPSMFITMLYGVYDLRNHCFSYASAGHEPGFRYIAEKGRFEDLFTKGLVLGVSRNATYKEYRCKLESNDMIILLTDGVTECRSGNDFIERETISEIIKENIHLPAQEIVDNVYRRLEKLQDFELRDDFTLIIIRRQV
ncbi:PP2C family protein-serine/threonine phosphatase [Bacillus solimangrovi]|uniref:Phosphoserine phosphatase n=1 Tax=Bacillus solimangrovi TaxID=1305675 RepID=A0A1E5LG67_9BACI|nr:PP2C family protein-serine/threonine phosphatase [Bacillus solimangrovi]OEH93071.1 phosphoserine phosphatase [Bacillus solimangrovi]